MTILNLKISDADSDKFGIVTDNSRFSFHGFITMTSRGHHGVSNHWQLDCLFKFRLAIKKTLISTLLAFCNGNPVKKPAMQKSVSMT